MTKARMTGPIAARKRYIRYIPKASRRRLTVNFVLEDQVGLGFSMITF
jgi:hypothetical protein